MRNVFGRLDEKHKWLEIFEKTLKISDENSKEKIKFLSVFGKSCCYK